MELFPEIEPFNKEYFKVSDIHELYIEECGRPDGNPVLFIHGGPGGGMSERDRRFFDPNVYRIILFDQRGSGKSRPPADLRENTTWDLVADIEKIRNYLKIDKWVVFGGSWGSTLSLLYAESYPDKVKALILRGIFTLRRKELSWLYQEGASYIYPDVWEDYLEPIPVVERHDMISAYYRRLTGDNEEVKQRCAKAWSRWEMATSRLIVDTELLKRSEMDQWTLQFARIECHYFIHGGWFTQDDQILNNIHKILHIPTTIIQGRYDIVCPATTAWELHKKFPAADLQFVPDAGHSSKEESTQKLLLAATEKYKNL